MEGLLQTARVMLVIEDGRNVQTRVVIPVPPLMAPIAPGQPAVSPTVPTIAPPVPPGRVPAQPVGSRRVSLSFAVERFLMFAAETTMNDIQSPETDAMDVETGCPAFPPEKSDKLTQVMNRKYTSLPARWSRANNINVDPKDSDAAKPKNRSGRMTSFFKNLKGRVKSKPLAGTSESSENQIEHDFGQPSISEELNTLSDAGNDEELQRDVSLGHSKNWWKRVWGTK
ncbi:Hypothetical protein CINCED_3A012330 [Cinara cedri]|uniref:Uncharacterized protein n=1 Tax=Cinara cedri TaxID=506608 RepID=A0A5E4MRD5_9HEMI|nr:Hypothetical protein CINCED_3A012330 [Cinara cedri]